MKSGIIPYKPYHRPLLTRALEDEGLTKAEMTFDRHPAAIVMDEKGFVGFFSFRMLGRRPYLNHFLVFKNRRCFASLRTLFHAFAEIVIRMGQVEFIAETPPEKSYFKRFVKYWTGKNEPYTSKNGTDYYLIHVKRKGAIL